MEWEDPDHDSGYLDRTGFSDWDASNREGPIHLWEMSFHFNEWPSDLEDNAEDPPLMDVCADNVEDPPLMDVYTGNVEDPPLMAVLLSFAVMFLIALIRYPQVPRN